MYQLSILIPSRNEEFLARTVQDLLEHKSPETEIIVGLDGSWSDPPLTKHKDVTVVYFNKSQGQRGMTNHLCRLSRAKYVAKTDAHCAFDQDFDLKMLEAFKETGDNVVMIPIMKNLHAFDWVCKDCEARTYQDTAPKSCYKCNSTNLFKDVMWEPKKSPNSTAFCFDSEPHFQYHGDRKRHKDYLDGSIVGYKLSFDKPSLPTSVIGLLTDFASSHHFTSSSDSLWFGQDVPMDTVGLSSVNSSGGVRVDEIKVIGDKSQVGGITTGSVSTDVVNNGNVLSSATGNWSDQPSVGNTMCELFLSEIGAPSITTLIDPTNPVPTTRKSIYSNIIKELNNILGGEFIYSEKTSRFHNGSVALIPIYNKEISESMSIQGSFFMCTRENYWRLNLGDEEFGSWGSQGIQVACSFWLSGGRVLCNHRTWYAHMFRTKADFGFPYPNPGRIAQNAKKLAKNKLYENKWPHQIYPSSWLVERFAPVPGWSDDALKDLKEHERPLNNP